MALLQADQLSVGGKDVALIKQLSFSLEPGRVLGLVGESGAGKSMVGRAIAQALPPGFAVTGGGLSFGTHDLVGMSAGRRRALLGREIAFIPQEPLTALNPVRSIGSQFGEHLKRLGLASAGERRARMLELFDSVHLPDAHGLLRRYPHQLSGGMCQRVLIAMAFASRPRLVVADEPTTALDVTIQARIVRLLAEMQANHGTAVLFITHDLRLAAQICDEIVVLYAGRAAERGPGRSLFVRPMHPYTLCLQRANPPMTGPRRALVTIPDQMPGLRDLAAMVGCRFATRCPTVAEDCRRIEPPERELEPGHVTACLHVDRIARLAAPGDVLPVPPPSDGTPVLQVEGLGKRFLARRTVWGRRIETIAVQSAHFAIAPGEFVALVGESGSGKSTVARMVAGLERPSAGRIILDGQEAGRMRRTRRIRATQMVFQDPQSALNPRRRVGAIVTMAMQAGAARTTPDARLQRAAALLAEVGLSPEIAGRTPSQLSGGQRQRVNIARALCVLPRLLVADEIVSGLDVSVQAQLLNLLLRLRTELGFAMLFISHDLSVVRYLCTRVLVMHRGEIVEQGTTDEVFAHPQHPYTQRLLAAVPPDDPAQVWAA
jgi:peptide/nickel transport system ATP-binding protein